MMKKYFLPVLFVGLSLVLIFSCKKDKVIATCESNETVYFSTQIMPMIQENCISCHDAGMTAPTLTGHANVASNANLILSSLKGEGVQLMPLGGPALNDSLINQFSCWISQGKKNN
jgi:hypothetical protein